MWESIWAINLSRATWTDPRSTIGIRVKLPLESATKCLDKHPILNQTQNVMESWQANKLIIRSWEAVVYYILPGQTSWHCSILILLPVQICPPFSGSGFEQKRLNIFVPFPHLAASQVLNSVHSDQPPSTMNNTIMKKVRGVGASLLVQLTPGWAVRFKPWPGILCCVLGQNTFHPSVQISNNKFQDRGSPAMD